MPALASTCAVLIVDDHADTARMVQWFFERQGLDVEVADSGTAALDLFERGARPTCVVLDLMMPDMSGLEVLRRLKSRPDHAAGTHVFMYSASFDWRDQQAAEALGAEAWFVKGVTPLADILTKVISRCVIDE
jgi:CheY-like chemotaxis protein